MCVHERREELHAGSTKLVTEIRGAVESRIDQLSDHFEEQLKLLQEAEQPLHVPFANEMIRVRVIRKDTDGSEIVEYQEVALRERMRGFPKLANEKHGVLQDLMDQWVDTQRELLQLSAEVLGEETLKLDDKQLYPELLVAVRAGEEEHDKNDSQYQDIVSDMEPLEKEANDLTAETKKSATRLVKVSLPIVVAMFELTCCAANQEDPKGKGKAGIRALESGLGVLGRYHQHICG